MGLVDIEQRAKLPRQRADAGQIGEIAVHAEHAFGDDQAIIAFAGPGPQQAFEMVAVIVLETHQPRAGEQGALQQRMMGEAVGENGHRASGDLLVGQSRDGGEIGLVAGGHDESGGLVLGLGDARLQFGESGMFARHQTRGGDAGAIFSAPQRRQPRSARDAGSGRDNRCWRN